MLNKIEQEIFDYIRKSLDNGIPPTVREICEAVGCNSTATVNKYIDILKEKGYIEKSSGQRRHIKLANYNSVNIPFVSCENYTENFLEVENILGFISWTPDREYKNPLFALKIESDFKDIFSSDDIIIAERTDEKGKYYICIDEKENLIISDNHSQENIGKIVSIIKYIS
jgi:repressor LexA